MTEHKYAFFSGCVSRGACRELYDSTKIIAPLLGIELVELKSASCCGAGVIQEREPILGDTLNARNLALAEQLKLPMLTQCSTCQGVLTQANQKLSEDKTYLDQINKVLEHDGQKYLGTTSVKHLLWVLVQDYGLEKLKAKIKKPLLGLKCASFYGCYLLRPSTSMTFDDPHHPTSMERLFEILGGTPVYYEGRTKCCGFPISMMNQEASLRMAGQQILDAKNNGADCIVTPCPLCHLNLDSRQPEVERVIKQKLDMPILHLSQLIGLALGVDWRELKMQRHIMNTESVIQKLQ